MADNPYFFSGRSWYFVAVPEKLFNLFFGRIWKFEPIAVKELNPIVRERVMGSRYNYPGIIPLDPGQIGYPWCWNNSHNIHINSGRTETGSQCRFNQSAGDTGIPSYQKTMYSCLSAKISTSRSSQLKCQLRKQGCINNTTDTIGSK